MQFQKPTRKTILIGLVAILALAVLFFGESNLADFFFLIAGVIAILAYYKVLKLEEKQNQANKKLSEKLEEIEFKLDKLEKPEEEKNE